MFKKLGLMIVLGAVASPVMANTYMDAAWAKKACNAWNQNATLTAGLAKVVDGKSWIKNNGGRGYKLIRMYRSSCGAPSSIQMVIQDKGGKAMCSSAGKADGKKMNFATDYLMHASDKNWKCMGAKSFGCGAMGAMMSGKLKFQGPKMEAMSVMGPFGAFLQIAGKLPGDKASCPK